MTSLARGKKTRILLSLGVATSVLLTACGGGDSGGGGGEERNENLTFATGGTGGVYYPYGGGIANVLTEQVEGVEATAEATNASAENIRLVCAGDSDIGFTLADTAADAVNGEAGFDGQPQSVQALARIYSNFTQVFVRADAGVSSLADLAGK